MTGGELIGWAVAAGVAYLAGYLIACAVWPFASCRRCGGGGRKLSPSKKYWRPCRRCKGSGTRVRIGRRVWDRLIVVKDKAVG